MTTAVRRSALTLTLLCSALLLLASWRWPLLGDASLMHYVVFLADHGRVPYRDTVDVNLPGTYLIEWCAMHLFGPGDLAWRLYDAALSACAVAAMGAISAWAPSSGTRSNDWLPGTFAGLLFFLLHGRDGVAELGQRDLLLSVLILWAVALLLCARRRRSGGFLVAAALAAGFAVSVKPTAILFWIVALGWAAVTDQSRFLGYRRVLVSGTLPLLAAPAVFALTLIHAGALAAFWRTLTELDYYHNSLFRMPTHFFLTHLLPSSLVPLALPWAVLLAFRITGGHRLLRGIDGLLMLEAACGILSFIVQGKAYCYHRYPMDAFLLLLFCAAFFHGIECRQNSLGLRVVFGVAIALAACVLPAQSLLHVRALGESPRSFSHLLQADLSSLGGQQLAGKLQCLDFTAGCVTTLYRMQLPQSTGFLYDCYLYGSDANAAVRHYRSAFLTAFMAHPAEVLIISDQSCGEAPSFGKLSRWPILAALVESRYALLKEVTPPDPIHWASQPAAPYRYRIYLLRQTGIDAFNQPQSSRQ